MKTKIILIAIAICALGGTEVFSANDGAVFEDFTTKIKPRRNQVSTPKPLQPTTIGDPKPKFEFQELPATPLGPGNRIKKLRGTSSVEKPAIKRELSFVEPGPAKEFALEEPSESRRRVKTEIPRAVTRKEILEEKVKKMEDRVEAEAKLDRAARAGEVLEEVIYLKRRLDGENLNEEERTELTKDLESIRNYAKTGIETENLKIARAKALSDLITARRILKKQKDHIKLTPEEKAALTAKGTNKQMKVALISGTQGGASAAREFLKREGIKKESLEGKGTKITREGYFGRKETEIMEVSPETRLEQKIIEAEEAYKKFKALEEQGLEAREAAKKMKEERGFLKSETEEEKTLKAYTNYIKSGEKYYGAKKEDLERRKGAYFYGEKRYDSPQFSDTGTAPVTYKTLYTKELSPEAKKAKATFKGFSKQGMGRKILRRGFQELSKMRKIR